VTDSPFDTPEFRDFANDRIDNLLPMIQGSSVVISFVPKGPSDVKFALELGFAMMLDKPVILAVHPGTPIPDKLRRIADAIVEADITTPEGRESFARRLPEEMIRIGLDPEGL
jgi:hypothetical protein